MTERQREILEVIQRNEALGNIPLTVREIGSLVGLRSSCTVQRHLEALVREGYLIKNARRHRTARTAE